MVQDASGVFNPDALEANRAGRLTDGQRSYLRQFSRSNRGTTFVMGAICIVGGVALARRGGANGGPYAWLLPYAGVAAAVIGALLVLHAAGLGDGLLRDLRRGRVETIEGAVTRDRGQFQPTGAGRGIATFYIEVGGQRFRAGLSAYDATPDAGIVRLYYLPASRRMVNLERLPDRPLPEGVFDSPAAALKLALTALRSHDRAQSAEARASIEAMKNAMIAGVGGDGAPPPLHERDPRPLAEAIVGTWRSGPVTMGFSAEGTVTAQLPGGLTRQGHWSVDAAGRLHADATGQEVVGDAWVAGDALTISAGDTTLTLRRA